MSVAISVPIQDRWSARSMVVTKWTLSGQIRQGDQVAELLVDGSRRPLQASQIHPDDYAAPYYCYVAEGCEVGPSGTLLEVGISVTGEPGPWVPRLHPAANRPLRRRDRYPEIFLNYRREDADAYAGRLHESLSQRFGREKVFMDLFSIKPGEIFRWTIQQAVVHARVVVALIGPKWTTLTGADGRPRLQNPHDILRLELTAAWNRGVRIIPVLLPGASIPNFQSVYLGDLRGIEDLQMLELNARHWDASLEELTGEIDDELSRSPSTAEG